jgi:putative component of membrane protein insertase Oxa1/YidC/SpoIIIJ protein YidD
LKKAILLFSLSCAMFFLKSDLSFAGNRMKGPASLAPIHKNYPSEYQTSSVKFVLESLIRFYASAISPADGPRSPSYPTGTAYGIQAVNQYGFFPGIFLIGDRLLHEADKHPGPEIMVFGRKRHYDPLEHNTFWWDPSVLAD